MGNSSRLDMLTSGKIYASFSEGKKFDLVKTEILLLKYLIGINAITSDKLYNTKFFCPIEDIEACLENKRTLSAYVDELKDLVDMQIKTLPMTIENTKLEMKRREEEEKKKTVERKARKVAKKLAAEAEKTAGA